MAGVGGVLPAFLSDGVQTARTSPESLAAKDKEPQ